MSMYRSSDAFIEQLATSVVAIMLLAICAPKVFEAIYQGVWTACVITALGVTVYGVLFVLFIAIASFTGGPRDEPLPQTDR